MQTFENNSMVKIPSVSPLLNSRPAFERPLDFGAFNITVQAGAPCDESNPEEAARATKAQILQKEVDCSELRTNKSKYNAIGISSTGFDQAITTLTQIQAKIIRQKLTDITFADYIPVDMGGGAAYAEEIMTWVETGQAGDFESGIVKPGRGRLATVDAHLSKLTLPIIQYAFNIEYNLFEVNQAAARSNWSYIERLEEVRYKNVMQGLQKIAFLGASTDSRINGLYSLDSQGVTIDTVTMTKPISQMTADEFNALLGAIFGKYFTNSSTTLLPDTFLIPSEDYYGLSTFISPTFPGVGMSKINALTQIFRDVTQNPNARVGLTPYGNQVYNKLGHQRYVLYRNDPEILEMHLPIPYTQTTTSSLNGYNFSNVAYGQFTGVQVYNPAGVYYMDFS